MGRMNGIENIVGNGFGGIEDRKKLIGKKNTRGLDGYKTIRIVKRSDDEIMVLDKTIIGSNSLIDLRNLFEFYHFPIFKF
jgi:hypothetical protein